MLTGNSVPVLHDFLSIKFCAKSVEGKHIILALYVVTVSLNRGMTYKLILHLKSY